MTQTLTTADGTKVSDFVFGTMQFGGRADATESQAMYDAARGAGVTHFDTAYVYTEGNSERLLGQFIEHERDRIFLATKVAMQGDASPENIRTQFDISRQRLRQDYVDLLYLHRWTDDPLEETFSTLAELIEAGYVRHIGVSNFAAWQVMKAQFAAASFGVWIDVIQPMYNLVKRQAEVELLPMSADLGQMVCPYSPLGGGLLTGKYSNGQTGRLTEDDMYRKRYGQTWMHDAATALSEIAADHGVHPATLAVSWVRKHSVAPCPIISAKSAQQLEPSLAAVDFDMDDDLYATLTALTPTPPPATDRLEEQ